MGWQVQLQSMMTPEDAWIPGPATTAAYLIRLSAGRGPPPLGGLGGSCSGGLPPSSGVTSCTTLPSSVGAADTLVSGEGRDGVVASSAGVPATGTGKAMPWPFSRA